MAAKAKHRYADHLLPGGVQEATAGCGCKHDVPLGNAPVVRCTDLECREIIGRICPDCKLMF